MPDINNQRLEYLFERYFLGDCTEKEREELLICIEQARHDKEVKRLMDRAWDKISPGYHLDNEQSEQIVAGILSKSRYKKSFFIKWSAAAAILLILLIGSWMWFNRNENSKSELAGGAIEAQNDVAPGGKRAILVLGNGSSMTLDSAHNGLVTKQGGVPVIKMNGQLSYSDADRTKQSEEVTYNTLVTPRGGQYKVILQDGTVVWLNAASSLRFPTFFTGNDRSVELTGEAYFEVASNQEKPFIVKVNDMEVKVLGTHLDVRAYEDEDVTKTVLLEGAVKVSAAGKQVLLKPGQEASVDHADLSQIAVSRADPKAVVAWKDGLFLFHSADLKTVMDEIARWYDVGVVYNGNVQTQLNGMISRNTNLSRVLHMLEITTNLTFRIEGKKIIVMPSSEGS